MKLTGSVAVKSGRVTMKMGKQGKGRWAMIGGKRVLIEPSGWTERIGGKLPKGVLHREDYDEYLNLMEESRHLLRNGETKQAQKALDLAQAALSASKTKEGEVPEYLTQQKEEHARRRVRNEPLEIKRMVKQDGGKWITVGGKKVKIGAKGSGKKKSQQRTIALLQDDLLGAKPSSSAYGALKSAIYNVERGKDPEGKPIEGWKDQTTKQKTKQKLGKVPDNALNPSKKLAREAKTFEDFERSLGTLTGHQYVPGEVDEKYYGRKGVKQFYEEFHKGDS